MRALFPLSRPLRALLLVPAVQVVVSCHTMTENKSRSASRPFSVVEASIVDLQTALDQHRTTSRDIMMQYLSRIALYEDRLNAVITVNPRALAIADSLDHERAEGKIRGPLHGIPIALKDNIQTTDIRTTGGSLAFADFLPPFQATVVRKLVDAGAIIIAKTQLTEMADAIADGMPSNYSALAGYSMNPWDPRRDPRLQFSDGRGVLGTGGSSSGVGTNVSFWAASVGTETTGSILTPAQQNMLVGIKPTVGRISRFGVIPFTLDQDTPGPMARTVTDAALLLGVLEDAKPDPADSMTGRCSRPPHQNYLAFLRRSGLRDARIGIPRAYFSDSLRLPDRAPAGGLDSAQQRLFREVIEVLKREGATIIDPADLPSVVDTTRNNNIIRWFPCSGTFGKGRDDGCSVVYKFGFKRDFNAWLASLGAAAPVKTLTELRQWNLAHQRAGSIKYGQGKFDTADEMDVTTDLARYQKDRRRDILLAATNGIDAALKQHRLDAIVFPGVSGRNIAARAGYPTVFVPYGFLPSRADDLPQGFDPRPAPFGVSFTSTACSEPRLIEFAYAFEQATRQRSIPPQFR